MWILLVLLGQLANPSFEEGTRGWTMESGAQKGDGPAAAVEVDGGELRFVTDAATRRWPMAVQTVDCPAGSRVLFTVAGRCKGLRAEAGQFENANAVVMFFDAGGKRLGIAGSPVLRGDRERIDLHVHALAPPGAAKAKVGFFSSMTGTAWFDDARLTVAPAEDRAAAADALRLHFDRTYPYLALHGRPGELGDGEIGPALRAMLAPLKDLHVWIDTPSGQVWTVDGSANVPNLDAKAIRGRLTDVVLEKPPHFVGRMGGIGYAFIGAWKKEGFGDVEAAIDKLEGSKALILDVRANGGGDELLARRIAGRFTAKPVVYGRAQPRDPTLPGDGFLEPLDKRLDPSGTHDARKVVVLQGPCCVSSTEWFLLMMGALDNVTTVGLASRGATGNPQPFPLFPGVNVWVPTQRGLFLDGTLIEGRGVPPDEEVGPGEEGKDPALERALSILAEERPTRVQLRDEVGRRVIAALPGAKLAPKDDLTLAVKRADGTEQEIRIDNLWHEIERAAPEEREAMIAQFVKTAVRDPWQEMDADRETKLKSLVPLVRDAAYVEEMRKLSPPATRALAADLVIVYAYDREDSMAIVPETDFKALGLTADELHLRSVENLNALIGKEVELHTVGSMFMVTCGGTYESSLLVTDKLWKKLAERVKGDLVAACPARDLLLFTDGSNAEGMAALRKAVEETFEEGGRLISKKLLKRTADGWKPLEE